MSAKIQTWNGKPLSPGEIVILHWVPGLGQQLTALLKQIRAQHLNPTPLTVASFTGIAPQQHSLNGDCPLDARLTGLIATDGLDAD